MGAVTVSRSHTVGVPLADAFASTLAVDLDALFTRRFGPIPAIAGVRDQTGPWTRRGETRTIVMGDGNTMREELTGVDAPRVFTYRITDPTGPLGLLARSVDGRWQFDRDSSVGSNGVESTTVTWQWTIHPRSVVARPAVRVFGMFWKGMARRALTQLETHLLHAG